MHFVLCYVGYQGMIFEKVVLFCLSYRIYIVYIQLRIYSNSEYLAIHFWLLSSPLTPVSGREDKEKIPLFLAAEPTAPLYRRSHGQRVLWRLFSYLLYVCCREPRTLRPEYLRDR